MKGNSALKACLIVAGVFLVLGILGSVSAFFLAGKFLGYTREHAEKRMAAEPELRAFHDVQRLISGNGTSTEYGENQETARLAGVFRDAMQEIRAEISAKEDQANSALGKQDMITYCKPLEGGFVMLVRVPELHDYSGAAKEELRAKAWIAAQNTLTAAGHLDTELVLGIMGGLAFDATLLGRTASDAGVPVAPPASTKTAVAEEVLQQYFIESADSSLNDEGIASGILGGWEHTAPTGTIRIWFTPDGIIHAGFIKNGWAQFRLAGTWKVEKGAVICVYAQEQSTLPFDEAYQEPEVNHIISLDDSRMVVHVNGQRQVWSRLPDSTITDYEASFGHLK